MYYYYELNASYGSVGPHTLSAATTKVRGALLQQGRAGQRQACDLKPAAGSLPPAAAFASLASFCTACHPLHLCIVQIQVELTHTRPHAGLHPHPAACLFRAG
jgi:hypothetical protein